MNSIFRGFTGPKKVVQLYRCVKTAGYPDFINKNNHLKNLTTLMNDGIDCIFYYFCSMLINT